MTSDDHKAPRTAQERREAGGPGIAYLSVAEAALRLGVHRNTIESWYRFRGLPVVRVGNVVRIRDVDLDTWPLGKPGRPSKPKAMEDVE